MRILVLPILPLLLASAPAGAQTSGLCSAIADRAARMECLGQPASRAPAPPPLTPTTRGCTTAAPCSDARGSYYTTHSGGKRYITRR